MKIMKVLQWNDGLLNGGRRPHLMVIDPRDGSVVEFLGENIPQLLAITSSDYQQNGKWSNTTFRFRLGTGVVAVAMNTRLHEKSLDCFPSWEAVIEAVREEAPAADFDQVKSLVSRWYPKGAE